jgi:hypothetical protein
MMRTGWRRALKVGGGVLAVVAVAAVVYVLRADSRPLTRDEITAFVDGLNESAAVDTPYRKLMTSEQRTANAALLGTVESGRVLSPAESAAYRLLYQETLRENQRYLSLFDGELTVRRDQGMGEPNNVGGTGIQGAHDHHDASARANFARLLSSLHSIETAGGWTGSFTRIRAGRSGYKNLTDIVLHLGTAPQTKSVVYEKPGQPWADPALGACFESMLQAFKAAQFSDVNSPDYVAAVHRALDQYDDLVWTTQARIAGGLGPLERRLAGRWLSLQSLSPTPSADLRPRFPRLPRQAAQNGAR